MAMLNETALRLCFRERLDTVEGIAEIKDAKRISYENHTFTPKQPTEKSDPGLWVQEFIEILNEPKSSTGFIEATGETLYLVFVPNGKGTKAADTLAQAIAEAFQSGQSLHNSSITVILEHTVRRPYRAREDTQGWIFKTVSVRWRTFTEA